MRNEDLLEALGDSILYIASLLGNRPRRIDHYIDYFGETARRPEPKAS